MNNYNQGKISKYEGFMILENNSNLIVYINNNRIPVFVYLCFLLIILWIFFLFEDILAAFILLAIGISFSIIGLKNRVDIPIISIKNDSLEFIGKGEIKTNQIKNLTIETRIKFYYNLLGAFFSYPYRVIFILNDLSQIDLNITFALKSSAQNFIDTINNHIKQYHAKQQ